MVNVVTNIEKKGPVIICHTDDPKGRTYKLDFSKKAIYGISNKEMNSTSSILEKVPSFLSTKDNIFYCALCAFRYNINPSRWPIVESLLSYPDLIQDFFEFDMMDYIAVYCNNKLPKNYVPWCRENQRCFSLCSLKDFIREQQTKQWPQQLRDFIEKFYIGTNFDFVNETHCNKELCISLMHIVKNSIKRYEVAGLIGNIQKIIATLMEKPQLLPYLDDTKSAKLLVQILKNHLEKERNDKMLANEAKISALDGMMIEDLLIKIPSTIDDFTDEGNQQHNCVGYFYHNRIAKGTDLIYFLRKADAPKVSWVTCRFSTLFKETVEHRLRFNEPFAANSLFEKIDGMINNLLNRN